MEELILNNRRLKLVDGEIWSWKPTKNPYWRKVTFTIDKDGYYFISLCYNKIKKQYKVHRVIYKFYNRDWDITYSPNNEIDHFDNDKGNNNIENLRVVNSSENKQNVISRKGYYWNKRDNKYQAEIRINYKKHSLGYYDTAEEARAAYLVAKAKYHIDCY